jgi:hypothetical protein
MKIYFQADADHQAFAITRIPEGGVTFKEAKAALEALGKYIEAAASQGAGTTPAANVPPGDTAAPPRLTAKALARGLFCDEDRETPPRQVTYVAQVGSAHSPIRR